MSLDVYLYGPKTMVPCTCPGCGNEHEREDQETYFSYNITHNLGRMADEAGIYEYLWRPDEIAVTKASQLIQPLRDGLAILKRDPTKFKQWNPKNGWGCYENLVSFVEEYLAACETHPDAEIYVSR